MRRTVVLPDPLPDLLLPAEAALLLRVDPKTLSRWAKAGMISSVRTVGGHRRYPLSEMRRIMDGDPPADEGAAH